MKKPAPVQKAAMSQRPAPIASRVDAGLKRRIEAAAAAERRTVSQWLAIHIEELLDAMDRKK